MKILVLNRGSSSIKCSIYDFSKFPNRLIDPIWKTKIEWETSAKKSLKEKLASLLSGKDVDCIGHRIVHGGEKYREKVFIDAAVKTELFKLSDLAPLHNKADIEGIKILEDLFPGKPQIAVFDTAFHHTLPEKAVVYPGPYKWYQMGIKRFGFHGISFQYCYRRISEILEKNLEKVVICHLGSGASLCAIKNGKSVDTTMGFTPLEGLMMDTRSGSVDPGILLYLLEKEKNTLTGLSQELYEKSGLLGLSGISSDMRDVLRKASEGERRAQLAVDVYVHRLTSMIGSMIASLGGMDGLIFTAGIGENSSFIRKQVCNQLSFLGIDLKPEFDTTEDCMISSSHSKIRVLVIHTQEAFEIARECFIKFHGE